MGGTDLAGERRLIDDRVPRRATRPLVFSRLLFLPHSDALHSTASTTNNGALVRKPTADRSREVLMPAFTTRLSDGWQWATDNPRFALVPLLTALLSVDNVARVLAFEGRTVGFKLGLPLPITDAWRFVNVPAAEGTVAAPLPLMALGVVLQAVLLAGYLGSMRSLLATGEYDPVAAVRSYTVSMLAYQGAIFVVGLVAIVFGTAVGTAGLVVLMPVVLALGYLFYATPYLLVLREQGLEDALRRSADLALAGGPFLRFTLGYAGLVLVLSPFATVFVANLGIVGVLVGAVVGAPVGLAVDVTTMRFVADLEDHDAGFGERISPGTSWP